jgi:hypothetical protein
MWQWRKSVFFNNAASLSGAQGSGANEHSTPADLGMRVKGREKGNEEEFKKLKSARTKGGQSLFQEAFFFCDVKNVGEVHGTGCIYVETVVDRDTGCAFAKVYPAKNPMNAVDILSSRVLPYFKELGVVIREIHTRKTPEYCGLVPLHPFETFLATSRIRHLSTEQPGKPYNYLCVQFYRFLQKEFFQPALRKKFMLSLDELQIDLDAFMEAYNDMQWKQLSEK